ECMEGTRQDILAVIRSWVDDINAPNILWLKGYPGVGKSAVASSLVEHLGPLKRLGSSFFFRRDNANDMTPNALWRVVASDLVRQYPPIKEKIVAALKLDEAILKTVNADKLFCQLIFEPLVDSAKMLSEALPVVVIDALDECGGLEGQHSEHRRNLLQTLKSWSRLPGQFKLFVTSRDESDINQLFSTTGHHLVEICTGESVKPQSSQDIATFLKDRFQKIACKFSRSLPLDWPGQQVIQDLTTMAQGLFIWVRVITNFADRGVPQKRLNQILSGGGAGGMTALYSLILKISFSDQIDDEDFIEHLHSVLGAVILAKVPLSMSSLRHLLSIQPDTMEYICNGLQAVMDSQSTLRIHHQSFVDFLIDQNECPQMFFIDRKRESWTLVVACLRTMEKDLRFNICNLETSYIRNEDVQDIATRVDACVSPQLGYASCFWASHLAETPFKPEIMGQLDNFMIKQFLYWLEILSVMKRVNIASGMLWTLINYLQIGGQTDAMARDMQKFVATFGSVISRSLPHIYLSALPFAPRNSAVSRSYIKDYPKTLTVQTGGLGEWPVTQNVLVGHEGGLKAISFSPDGKRIVSGSSDKTIRVWDAETGEVVAGPLEGHDGPVLSIGFSPDGRRIVSGSSDRTARVWNAETGELVTEPLKGHADAVNSVGFSPDGKRILSGSSDRTIRVWDVETGEVVTGPLKGHDGLVVSVKFSPDGRKIVSGSSDRTIRVCDAETGKVVTGPLEGHSSPVLSVVFSFDGRRIISGSSDRTVRVWNADTGELIIGPLKGHADAVNSVDFSPDGRKIVSGSSDSTIRVWNTETGEIVAGPLKGHNDWVRSVEFSPDGRRIASGSSDKTIRVWDAETSVVPGSLEGHNGPVLSVSYSPDGKMIVSGSTDRTVRVWDAETGNVVAGPLKGHIDAVNSVSFSPNGKRIVSGSGDKAIRMWDAETGKAVAKPLKGHNGTILSVKFSLNGKKIVSGSSDKTVRVWDAETGKVVAGPLTGHKDWVRSVEFSPDGKQIVSSSDDRTIRLWDVETGKAVAGPLEGHNGIVLSVSFSPDGRKIVSSSDDKTIRVWDAKTRKVIAGPLEGHNGLVFSVGFSPDGTKIVSGSSDGTIRVWDPNTGKMVAGPLKGHIDAVNSICFSPDSRRIVSASKDRSIRVWDAEIGEVVPGQLQGHIAAINSVASALNHKCIVSNPEKALVQVSAAASYTVSPLICVPRFIDKAQRWQYSTSINPCFDDNSEIEEGWVLGPNSELLFWVPPDLRAGLYRPGNTLVIGPTSTTILDLKTFVYGESWVKCRE
ncbi:hypothetical protein M408DRAFT_53919, partial [Serendipita vermifera MAFF 305830]